MEIVDVTDRNSDLLEKLTALWRRSVSKTHTFLTGKDIAEIEDYVPQALKKVEHLAVAQNNGDYLGFMGVEQHRLEMLFLDPQYIGQGIGRKLVEYGVERYQIDEVTVNEQNPHAVGFYEHLGFKTYKRTATDEQGRPFPLLYMRIAKMIRPLKIADLDVVMQIWLEGNLQAHDFIAPEYWRQNYDFVKKILPQSTVYVFEDGQIKGFIGLQDDFIAGIFVRRDCQGQGVGRQLLDFVKEQKHHLQLTVYEKNASAVEFYQQNGFTLISDQTNPDTCEKEFLMQWKA